MPRQYVLEFRVDLPADVHEMADMISKTKAPRDAFREALTSAGADFQEKSEIVDPKPSQPAARTGRPLGSRNKSKAHHAPAISFAPPSEAAD